MTNSEDTSSGDNLSTINSTSNVTDAFSSSSSSGSEHVNQLCNSGSQKESSSCSVENVNVTGSIGGSVEGGGGDLWSSSVSDGNGEISISHRNEDSMVTYISRTSLSCPTRGDGQHQLQSDVTSQASNLQPPPPPLPFRLIFGEKLEYQCDTSDGVLAVTNYRLFIKGKNTNCNIPIGVIEQVENREGFFLHVSGKDARCIRCTFDINETAIETVKRIQTATSLWKKIEDTFSFTFFKNSEETSDEISSQLGLDLPAFPSAKERFDKEIKRMEFNLEGPWKVSDENKDYALCSSYPTHIIVPSNIYKLETIASFRSARRFPAVVWRHRGNGAVISRCSQPEVGWFGWRCGEDEELVQSIVIACADNSKTPGQGIETERIKIQSDSGDESTSNIHNGSLMSMEVVRGPSHLKKLLILDARSYTTAVANRARGGGCECLEYYPRCEIQFMNLANIHSVRKSFMNVRQLCTMSPDQSNSWYSQLESCKWLQHMSGLMKAAITVVTAIEQEGRPVMVHCSDGWDRTPQIVALAEILLDPYYRSLEGFQVLVEREWLDFGHKFADRCGQPLGSDDANERCPVFLQWLDCLHQLIRQFPSAFEFNFTFLVKLAQHTYSNLFGTFLCNTLKERQLFGVEALTHSVWKFLRAPANISKFRNNLYLNCDKVLWPSCEVRDLSLWTHVYQGYENPPSQTTEILNPSQESSPAPSVAADCETDDRMAACKALNKSKTRSCEDLHSPYQAGLQRRQSDPNLSDSFHAGDSHDAESDDGVSVNVSTPVKTISNQMENSDLQNSLGYTADESSTGIGRLTDFEDSENDDTEPNSESKSESTVVSMSRIDPKSIESSTDTLVSEMAGQYDGSSDVSSKVIEGDSRLQKTDVARARENNQVGCGRGKTEIVNTNVAGGPTGTVTNAQMQLKRKAEIADAMSSSSATRQNVSKHLPSEDVSSIRSKMKVEMASSNEAILNDTEGIVMCGIPPPAVDSAVQCEVCATSRRLLDDTNSNSAGVHGINLSSTSNNNVIGSMSAMNSSNGVGIAAGNVVTKISSYNTPMHSRTPSTGVAVTLEDNGGLQGRADKQDNGFGVSNSALKSVAFDVDGLSSLHDEVQIRLHAIVSNYRLQIEGLQRELQLTRNALMKQVCHKCTNHMSDRLDDVASVGDSLASAEHQSVGHESQSSEISWEAVDEKDTRHPLWFPDFAATNCMGCEASFWLGRRKHHCRSCGKIFCADCSDQTITIPSEQFFTPVRVCGSCFQRLASHSSENVPGPTGSALLNDALEETGSSQRYQSNYNPTMLYANQNGCDHSNNMPPKSSTVVGHGQTYACSNNAPSKDVIHYHHSSKQSVECPEFRTQPPQHHQGTNGISMSSSTNNTSSVCGDEPSSNNTTIASSKCYLNHANSSQNPCSNLDTITLNSSNN